MPFHDPSLWQPSVEQYRVHWRCYIDRFRAMAAAGDQREGAARLRRDHDYSTCNLHLLALEHILLVTLMSKVA